ncbi:MAG: glucose-6-phosphate 1-epimerase [Gammaproteobacteria bacterium]|jgi:glucose-6-phosphate 1-epimerase
MQSDQSKNDFPKVTLTAADGALAELYLYGAQVTSWRPADGDERLFLSERAEFSAGKAIRGGVPVCFPQFAGVGPLLKHGFARLSIWKLLGVEQIGDSAQAILQLEDSAATRAIWPHAFRATLTVTVAGSLLRLEFKVQNTGATPFTFTAALHSYLQVHDISKTVVENLGNSRYWDAVTGDLDNTQLAPELRFNGEVDRVYGQVPVPVVVHEPGRRMTVLATGFPDVVLWNPGAKKCAALSDIEPAGYRRMLCVEAAVINEPPELQAGESWCGAQELRAS